MPPPSMAAPQPAPLVTYVYQCLGSAGRHYWTTPDRLDRPEDVLCPGRTIGMGLCEKPLQEFHGHSFFPPQPLLDVRRRSQMPVPQFAAPERRDSLLKFQPLRVEAQSQRDLTGVLIESGQVTFLCRNGHFAAPSPVNPIVDEPGITRHGPLQLQSAERHVVGRNEVWGRRPEEFVVSPFTRGNVTYPDFVVEQNGVVFAIELKTPRTATMAAFLRDQFYGEERPRDPSAPFERRAVEAEMAARAAILPDEWRQMLAFDLSNVREDLGASIGAIQEEIRAGTHAAFWRMIASFLFIEGGRVSTYSRDALLEVGTSQQTLRMDPTPALVLSSPESLKRRRGQECPICNSPDVLLDAGVCAVCLEAMR